MLSAVPSETIFLLDLGVLTAAALALSLVFAKLRLPVVSGQILAGMIVGPYVLGWVVDTEIISLISSIGIVLLLFIIGLELDPLELQKAAKQIVFLTLVETAIAFGFGVLASYVLGFSLLPSLVFAMTATISSTAIVGKIILERRMFQAGESKTLVGLMITEDIIAVGFLILLSTLVPQVGTSTSSQAERFIVTGLGGISLVVVGYIVARFLAPYAIDYLSTYEVESEEIPFLFALAVGLLFGVLAASLGYSPGIGSFIIGLAIRGKQSRFLFEKVTPLKDLFLVLFFVSMGSLINPYPALGLGVLAVAAIVLLVLGKFLGGFVAANLVRRGKGAFSASPSSVGAWLIPRGEFSLVIGQYALAVGLVDLSVFSLIGLSVLVTAILGPTLQRLTGPRLAGVEHAADSRTE